MSALRKKALIKEYEENGPRDDDLSDLSTSSDEELVAGMRNKTLEDFYFGISREDIINLPIDEFNDKLTRMQLTEEEVAKLRDVRRRGKNRVAARKSREKKIAQIDILRSEKSQIDAELKAITDQNAAVESKNEQWSILCESLFAHQERWENLLKSKAPDDEVHKGN